MQFGTYRWDRSYTGGQVTLPWGGYRQRWDSYTVDGIVFKQVAHDLEQTSTIWFRGFPDPVYYSLQDLRAAGNLLWGGNLGYCTFSGGYEEGKIPIFTLAQQGTFGISKDQVWLTQGWV